MISRGRFVVRDGTLLDDAIGRGRCYINRDLPARVAEN